MPSSRSRHIDVMRGAGILLVVFGHLIEQPASSSPMLDSVYNAIYSFHMPLFVFLAGIFARSTLKAADYSKIVWSLFVPLVVFQVVYVVLGKVTGWYSYSTFAPYWLLWFIASLIGWRILLPLVASPTGLVVATLGALLAGYDTGVGYALSASRTIYFLPFFVLGHLYGAQMVEFVQRRRVLFGLVFASSIAIVTYWSWHGLDTASLTGSHDYEGAPADSSFPALGRLGVLALGFTGLLGFAALVPKHQATLEWFGERSMSIYLVHGLVVMLFISSGAGAAIPVLLLVPAMVVLALLIAAATGSLETPMRRFFSPPEQPQGFAEVGRRTR